jgi:CBS domain-containing protein/sporulation protein YlmC with PRC-barrel domain
MPGTTRRSDARRQADAIHLHAWLPAMTEAPVFASRLRGRPLLDSEDMSLGRVRDVVILPAAGGDPPWVVGLVVTVQRHEIFVNLGRVAEISIDGVHLRGGTVDLRRFSRRTGEILASDLHGKRVEGGTVLDVGIAPSERRRAAWEVSVLAIGPTRSLGLGLGLRHNHTAIVPWDKHPELFKVSALAEQLVQLREMNPTDIANAVETLPDARRQELAEMLHDEQLADVLEELPEQDQVRLLASLGVERGADVVEEMQPDDAADVLAEMPQEQRERLLAAMENVQAADLRRLLRYDATTAGGLMTSQPLIVPPDTPVAEVLAQIRDPRMPTTSAAQVYVCEPPTETPTGRYLGNIGFQALLRQPPAAMVGEVIEDSGFVRPDLSEKEVARRMAAYNLIGVAVCDADGRLLGAITVDDVLDRILPAGWRKGETHENAAANDR